MAGGSKFPSQDLALVQTRFHSEVHDSDIRIQGAELCDFFCDLESGVCPPLGFPRPSFARKENGFSFSPRSPIDFFSVVQTVSILDTFRRGILGIHAWDLSLPFRTVLTWNIATKTCSITNSFDSLGHTADGAHLVAQRYAAPQQRPTWSAVPLQGAGGNANPESLTGSWPVTHMSHPCLRWADIHFYTVTDVPLFYVVLEI